MAVPACLRLADEVFPRVRAAAARRLLAAGWSQTRAAEALGISQAMVSKYAAQAAGAAQAEDALVARLADELAREAQQPTAGAGGWCGTLAAAHAHDGGRPALEDLLEAERSLRAGLGAALVPQIGLNVVRALPSATTTADVLGYPARLVAAAGRLLVPAPPELGGSGHLAQCLLLLRASRPDALALASARGGPDVVRAARKLGWRVAELPLEAGGHAGSAEARFGVAARQAPAADAFHDPGPPGIEPCLYIPGADARAVASSLLRLGTLMP